MGGCFACARKLHVTCSGLLGAAFCSAWLLLAHQNNLAGTHLAGINLLKILYNVENSIGDLGFVQVCASCKATQQLQAAWAGKLGPCLSKAGLDAGVGQHACS